MVSDGIACHILIQNEQLEQVDTFPYCGYMITEDGECMMEFCTRLNKGAGDWGIAEENTEKSQHTNYNKDTTDKSASVACSNVGLRLWKLDTQKEWRNTSWRLWDERAEKDSAGFMDSKKKFKWVGS